MSPGVPNVGRFGPTVCGMRTLINLSELSPFVSNGAPVKTTVASSASVTLVMWTGVTPITLGMELKLTDMCAPVLAATLTAAHEIKVPSVAFMTLTDIPPGSFAVGPAVVW